MPAKLTFDYVKEFINKENELISTEYINSKELLEIRCKKCSIVYQQCFSSYHRGCRCRSCSMSENGIKSAIIRYGIDNLVKGMTKTCIQCEKEFTPTLIKQKLCDKECALKYTKSDAYKEHGKINGSKGGTISAERQQRRSKNEIAFGDLCIQHFGESNVLCNVRYFKDRHEKLWDSDIILPKLKIAVSWGN